MLLVLSGEGVSDIGHCVPAAGFCSGSDFVVGPMAVLVYQAAEKALGYSPADVPECSFYVSESQLARRSKDRRKERRFALAGKKHAKETGFFYVNAWMLAEIAKELEAERADRSIAVLFRDSDGTRSAAPSNWRQKSDSVRAGFARAEYDRGVGMVPRPKSEAWLLSHADKESNCAAFEEISGNDASPHSAKQMLAASLGGATSSQELCDWLMAFPFDQERADAMLSWRIFREDLTRALRALL